MKLKLAKQAKKEPRKASFPWDLGLLFVQPMKYALIAGFNLFQTEKEIQSMQPTDFIYLACKMDDFLMLDLEGLMILFRIKIQTVSFEIADLCKFYFDIIDPNDNKAFEHNNQVRNLILKEEKKKRSACC